VFVLVSVFVFVSVLLFGHVLGLDPCSCSIPPVLDPLPTV
jgi:hypothetical protein